MADGDVYFTGKMWYNSSNRINNERGSASHTAAPFVQRKGKFRMASSDITTFDSATEEWRDVPGYEGYYQASSFGRIRSLERTTSSGCVWKSRIRVQVPSPSGRKRIRLSKANIKTMYFVDELIAAAFLQLIPSRVTYVYHRDGDTGNDYLVNLEVRSFHKKTVWESDLSTGQCIEIELTGGYSAIVDLLDSDLAEVCWHSGGSVNHIYGRRRATEPESGNFLHLHRVVLERKIERPLLSNEYVDHINGNTLDNRRSNLRVATKAQNQQNQRRRSDNSSGHKGVSWHKERQKWGVRIHANNQDYFIGYFEALSDARDAYAEAARRLHGEFANLGEGLSDE